MSRNVAWKLRGKCANDPIVQEELRNRYDRFDTVKTSATKYCSGCPVLTQCLLEALESMDGPVYLWKTGIWGGTTMRQRRVLKKIKQSLDPAA